MLTKLRLRNFKAWKDSGDIRLAPLTVLFGTNSAGKTSIPQLLLLLKQTAESPDRQRALQLGDNRTLLDAGTYDDVVHGHDISQPLRFRRNLSSRGQPEPGDAFFRWLLTHEWNDERVTRVAITSTEDDDEDFEELPSPPRGVSYDRSDRKFLAVAAAHADRPPILQSFDSKWWGWQAALAKIGVTIHFLCEHDIAGKHKKKMGR